MRTDGMYGKPHVLPTCRVRRWPSSKDARHCGQASESVLKVVKDYLLEGRLNDWLLELV
jgi:hypothetical protein